MKPIRFCCLLFCSLTLTYALGSCSTPAPSEPTKERLQDAGPHLDKASEPVKEASVELGPEIAREKLAERKVDAGMDGGVPESLLERLPEESGVQDKGQLEKTPEPGPTEQVPENAVPKAGFGAISGDCGVLDDTEWNSSQSFLFRNNIDFGQMAFDEKKLSAGGQRIWKAGNLGGNSIHSEIFAFEILFRCELGGLLKTEGEIKYQQSTGKKTDLLMTIDGRKIGVSVTRAYHFPPTDPYTLKEAETLLNKKLKDIPLSAANAATADAWSRSILYILAYNKQHADIVQDAYKKLDASVRLNIILIVTVTDGQDDFIY